MLSANANTASDGRKVGHVLDPPDSLRDDRSVIVEAVSDLKTARDSVVLLYSGGLDSTAAALLLRERGIRTTALTVEYQTRPAREATVCNSLARHLRFERHVHIDLPLADNRHHQLIWPSDEHEAWFPFRNIIFFGLAAHVTVLHGHNVVAAGIRAADGSDFDDASVNFLEHLSFVLKYNGCSECPIKSKLFLPLLRTDRYLKELLESPPDAGKLLRETWSCWRDEREPCNECSSCRDRQELLRCVERS